MIGRLSLGGTAFPSHVFHLVTHLIHPPACHTIERVQQLPLGWEDLSRLNCSIIG